MSLSCAVPRTLQRKRMTDWTIPSAAAMCRRAPYTRPTLSFFPPGPGGSPLCAFIWKNLHDYSRLCLPVDRHLTWLIFSLRETRKAGPVRCTGF